MQISYESIARIMEFSNDSVRCIILELIYGLAYSRKLSQPQLNIFRNSLPSAETVTERGAVNLLQLFNYKLISKLYDIATTFNQLITIKWLYLAGIPITISTLHIAAKNGQLDIVKYIIDKIHKRLFFSRHIHKNLMKSAIMNNHADVVKYFYKRGYLVGMQPQEHYLLNDAPDVLQYFMEVNVISISNHTLWDIAITGNLKFVKFLVSQNAPLRPSQLRVFNAVYDTKYPEISKILTLKYSAPPEPVAKAFTNKYRRGW